MVHRKYPDRFYQVCPPNYEDTIDRAEAYIAAEDPPSYEQVFAERLEINMPLISRSSSYEQVFTERPEISSVTVVPKKYTSIPKAIEMLTSGEIGYIRLDKKTTFSPMAVLEYFVEYGKSSHKDVYLLRVEHDPTGLTKFAINGELQAYSKVSKQYTFYLVSRKSQIDGCPGFDKVISTHSYVIIKLSQYGYISSNFVGCSYTERQAIIDYYISSVF